MALITEDGTGLADAESYCSVETADAYHVARGNGNAWAPLSTSRKWELLRLATDHMAIYSASWQGNRVGPVQALDWPRAGVEAFGFDMPADAVPLTVQNACAILALKALAGPLAPDLGPIVKRKKLGPIETEYADYSPQNKRYISVDRMLAPLLVARNRYSAPLVRG